MDQAESLIRRARNLQTAKCKTWRRLGEDFLDNSDIEGVMHG